MLSNVHSPYYFSGISNQEISDQWALVNSTNCIVLVDQSFKILKALEIILAFHQYAVVKLSDIKNFKLIDNVKCINLQVKNDKVSMIKVNDVLLLEQEKVMYLYYLIHKLFTELEFYDEKQTSDIADRKNKILAEREIFGYLMPGDTTIQNIYDADLVAIESYKNNIVKIREQVLGVLFKLDLTLELSVIQQQVKDLLEASSNKLRIDYFTYLVGKLV